MATPRRKTYHGDISYKIEHHNTVLTVTFNDFENVPCLNEEVSSTIFLVQGESRTTYSKYCNKGKSVNFEISPGRDVRETTVIIRLYRSYLAECNISNGYITERKGLSEVQIPLANVCFPTVETKPLQALSSAPYAQPKDVTSASHVSHTVERQTSIDKTAHQNELQEVVMNRNLSKHGTKHSDNSRQQTIPCEKPHSEEYDSTEGTQPIHNAKMLWTESDIIVASQEMPDQQPPQTSIEKYGKRGELRKKTEASTHIPIQRGFKDSAQTLDGIGVSNNQKFRNEQLSNHDVIIVDDSESVSASLAEIQYQMDKQNSKSFSYDSEETSYGVGQKFLLEKQQCRTEPLPNHDVFAEKHSQSEPNIHDDLAAHKSSLGSEISMRLQALRDFEVAEDCAVDLEKGKEVEKVKDAHGGWTWVRKKDSEGLVPTFHLETLGSETTEDDQVQNKKIKLDGVRVLEELSNLKAKVETMYTAIDALRREDAKKNKKISNLESNLERVKNDLAPMSSRIYEKETKEKDMSLNIKSPPKQVEGIHRQIVKQMKEVFETYGYKLRTNREGPAVVTVVNASRGQADLDRDVKAANLTSKESANFVILRIVPSKDPKKKVDKIKKEGLLLDIIFLADQKATMLLGCNHNTKQMEELVNYMLDQSL